MANELDAFRGQLSPELLALLSRELLSDDLEELGRPRSNFVYAPQKTPVGNVYNDFVAMSFIMQSIKGTKTAWFDPTDDDDANPISVVIPAGTYDQRDVEWTGREGFNFNPAGPNEWNTRVVIQDNVIFNNFRKIAGGSIHVECQATTISPVSDMKSSPGVSGDTFTFGGERGFANIECTGTKAFIELTDANNPNFSGVRIFPEYCRWITGSAPVVFNNTTGVSLPVIFAAGSGEFLCEDDTIHAAVNPGVTFMAFQGGKGFVGAQPNVGNRFVNDVEMKMNWDAQQGSYHTAPRNAGSLKDNSLAQHYDISGGSIAQPLPKAVYADGDGPAGTERIYKESIYGFDYDTLVGGPYTVGEQVDIDGGLGVGAVISDSGTRLVIFWVAGVKAKDGDAVVGVASGTTSAVNEPGGLFTLTLVPDAANTINGLAGPRDIGAFDDGLCRLIPNALADWMVC